MIINNQCEYAIYAEAVPFAESNYEIGIDLPLATYYKFYAGEVPFNQVDSGGVGGGNMNPYILYPFDFDTATVQDQYFRVNILPLLPDGWRDELPETTTFHLLYNRELFNNSDYCSDKIYGNLYIQYVGNDTYVRIDSYLGLDFEPSIPNTNEDIFFLYDLGQDIINNSFVDKLLRLDINGITFFDMCFGLGFISFAAWCIVKWIIPL